MVLVALDANRTLNNGEPASLSRWLDSLDLGPGDRFLHIGCGVGYYTAIAAEMVLPRGGVVGVEVDPQLAERAKRNLSARTDEGDDLLIGDAPGRIRRNEDAGRDGDGVEPAVG